MTSARTFWMRRGALVFAVLCAGAPVIARAQKMVVVVNSTNPTDTLQKVQLSNIFLKKVTKWSNNKTIVPVDKDRTSNSYDRFSKAVHGRSGSAVVSYWLTQVFSGNAVPPAEKASDGDVLAFVRDNPNAIGYVSADTPMGANVKTVVIKGL
jgi:ABC-type phosphate transport system substrate-binding protein